MMLKTFRDNVFLLFICSFMMAVSVSAQSSHKISGKVVDKVTREPIPYATVRAEIAGRSDKIAQADKTGRFSFTVPDSRTARIRLAISAVGYRAATTDWDDKMGEKPIYLTPDIHSIGEVEILGLPARAVVQKAYERIAMNYPLRPSTYGGFYQESVPLTNNPINGR